ncbi:MAG: HNH endonuclease signature motif containing protein [Corynebacterium camporealensis]|uniref:HNH endonuclease signature motif containing protein n=1 Tax=Corynebacterium camporealensis TaxID=161896 RepID=UPI002A91A085|nr:HNH endonuclease signature motif containing protein [Corynebacterium camporealensis]MDY5840364.1 HNH endonuclease signature motif containing protein [Corynebacterium camporealensis]
MCLQTYFAELGRGIDLVAECEGMSADDLTTMGSTPADAAELLDFYSIYFGPTKYTRKQDTAVRMARARGLALTVLREIERFVGRIKNQLDAWNLRIELCTADDANRASLARRRLRELRPKREPTEKANITQHDNGLATFRVTGNSADLTDIFQQIDQQKPAESFIQSYFGDNPTARTTPSVMAVLGLADYCRLLRGDNTDIRAELTNGATMTGTELIERAFLDQGLVTLIGREDGPVDLYRFQRFANEKQRAMLMAEFPHCAWPGCRVPASQCQFHHLKSWDGGGETNISNLIPLCPHHNGANEDDVDIPQVRGRMTRINGRVAWIPPRGGRPIFVGRSSTGDPPVPVPHDYVSRNQSTDPPDG